MSFDWSFPQTRRGLGSVWNSLKNFLGISPQQGNPTPTPTPTAVYQPSAWNPTPSSTSQWFNRGIEPSGGVSRYAPVPPQTSVGAGYNVYPYTPSGQIELNPPYMGGGQASWSPGTGIYDNPVSQINRGLINTASGAGGSTPPNMMNVGGGAAATGTGTSTPSWGNVPPPPSGVDPAWYAQWSQAFQQQHGGKTFVDYYAPTSGGNPYNAQSQALNDAAWGQQFYNTYGRPPSEYDWQARWNSGGGGSASTASAESSWWGEQIFGDGQVQWPGMKQPIDIKNVQYLDQIPPQYREWFQQVMNASRSKWPNPLIPPVVWTTPNPQDVEG